MTSVGQMTAKALTTLLSAYLFFFIHVQQGCHPGIPLRDIIFQIDSCEDALFTKCRNVGYAISSINGTEQITVPEGRYAIRIEDPRYRPERKTAYIGTYRDPLKIFYLYPPSGKCQ